MCCVCTQLPAGAQGPSELRSRGRAQLRVDRVGITGLPGPQEPFPTRHLGSAGVLPPVYTLTSETRPPFGLLCSPLVFCSREEEPEALSLIPCPPGAPCLVAPSSLSCKYTCTCPRKPWVLQGKGGHFCNRIKTFQVMYLVCKFSFRCSPEWPETKAFRKRLQFFLHFSHVLISHQSQEAGVGAHFLRR